MRYNGRAFDCEPIFPIQEATITDQYLSLSWRNGPDEQVHAYAVSDDGKRYEGSFGFPALDPTQHAAFDLFRAGDGELLLLGRCWDDNQEIQSTLLLRLAPKAD